MTHARQMIETNPSQVSVDTDALVECIEACFDCAQTCTACADACVGEEDIQMLALPPVTFCRARRRLSRRWHE